jgi:adenosylmethionine-8-amino-7-oxononanoate aminotransferase
MKEVSPDRSTLGIKFSFHVGMEQNYSICLYPGTGTADGKRGDHILICPAYNVTRSEIDLIVDRTTKVIENYFAERRL